jgi:hypothetical protein
LKGARIKFDQKSSEIICQSDYDHGDHSSADLSYAIELFRGGNREDEIINQCNSQIKIKNDLKNT